MGWTQEQYDFCRRVIPFRRERRKMAEAGYICADPTKCGFELFDAIRQRGVKMVDVKINVDGTGLFIKLDDPTPPKEPEQ